MWNHKNTFAIGGLENVGYAPNQDLLIVLSTQGQGIFNCQTGEKIARKYQNFGIWENFNEKTNSVLGFDLLSNTEIFTCGLYGEDNLSKITFDGWSLYISEPEPDDQPFEKYLVRKIYLISPNKTEKIFIAKDGVCEIRAFGFSETGKSLIVATSCDLTIFSKN